MRDREREKERDSVYICVSRRKTKMEKRERGEISLFINVAYLERTKNI